LAARIRETVRQEDELGDHMDDAAALAERDRLILEHELDSELHRKIDHALERIHEGAYGISEVSGKPIPLERLEVVLWATTLPDEEPVEDC
jgi:DnaK suppressor protein